MQNSPKARSDLALVFLCALGAALGACLVDGIGAANQAASFSWGILWVGIAFSIWFWVALAVMAPFGLYALARANRPGQPPLWALWAGSAACVGMAVVAGLLVGPKLAGAVSQKLEIPVYLTFVGACVLWLAPASMAMGALLDRIPWPRLVRRFAPWALALSGMVGVLGLYLLSVPLLAGFAGLIMGAGAAFGLRIRLPRRSLPTMGAAAGVAVVFFAIAAFSPPRAFRGPMGESLLLANVFTILETQSDDDRDGYGDHFGGSDCDDTNNRVAPGRPEIPGNKLDDNCLGGDHDGSPFARVPLPQGQAPDPAVKPHIIMVVVDALRPDFLGPEKGLTPNMDALAQQGTSFTRAFTPSSVTRMAVPGMLTGRWIGHTQYRETRRVYTTDPKIQSLPQALRPLGYRSVAIWTSYFNRGLGRLGRTFDAMVDMRTGLTGRQRNHANPRGVDHLRKFVAKDPEAPVFAYIHFPDVHSPYTDTDVKVKTDGSPIGRYGGEVARMDDDMALLMSYVKALAKKRPVLLALTADHGEGFGEHGTEHHGNDLFDNVVRVPLILWGYGIEAGKSYDLPVSLLDLTHTFAEAAGAILRDGVSQSLWGVLQGKKAPVDRPLFAEVRAFKATKGVFSSVTTWPYKLIVRHDSLERWLFNLQSDPGETRNLLDAEPIHAKRLGDLLAKWIDSSGSVPAGRYDKDK